MPELRKAAAGDDLRALWRLCFPEDDGKRFFERVYNPADTLVYADDGGNIAAMLHILPRSLRLWGRSVPAGYIFGVGTHPARRGKGLAGDLIEQAVFELHLRGVPLAVLLPCSEGVTRLYWKYGFAQLGRRPLLTGIPPCAAASSQNIPELAALYEAAHPCRAERFEDDWRDILAEYDVGLTTDGYAVWDERGLLELVPPPPDAPPHPLGAMLKVIDTKPLYALAAAAGLNLPPCGRSLYCPWDNGSAVGGAPPPEEVFFADEKPYVNLMSN